MSNVVSFPAKDTDRVVWRCNCGCLTHFVRADYELECAQCGNLSTSISGEWRKNVPDVPAVVADVEARDIKVTDLNSSEAAIRRVLLKADPDTLAVLVTLHKDGTMSVWGIDLDTPEEQAWFDAQMAAAKAMLTPKG
ncbi:hypothetical protein C5748_18375 [Phyllobacterium phragmitis]|uniref:Uncharacterized protein n=1 Tax=Phyllobacterium phragmitis TaxID=2670329 RepID=A0A2S9INK7_9HYPH|nr:hypothetical protein [Phyllobacterium phragmitis]PRD42116.1 hypothetical protein C5748_18375 [Phyllobacterium phragmitis]